MSAPAPESRPAAPLSDEALLHLHELTLADKTDDRGTYKLLPLVLLFAFSGLIFFGGTYLNLYSGHFDPKIFDERAKPHSGTLVEAKIDPVVFGKKQFESLCITCHQATGLGVPGVYPPLAKSEWINGSEQRIIRIVLYGLKGPVTVEGHTFGTLPMPAVGPGGQNWSDERIADVLTYVRQAFGNSAPPVTTEEVAAIRGKIGTRAEMSEPELKTLP